MKQKVLISSCLLGEKVRYNGSDCLASHSIITEWQRQGVIVAFCPEVAGGLSIPRSPAEILRGTGKNIWNNTAVTINNKVATEEEILAKAEVVTNEGAIVTEAFKIGAEQCLTLAQQYQIQLAVLKANSPSCGNEAIYDGRFSGQLRPGEGVTAALLVQHGIKVFNELQLEQAYEYWLSL
ncbi:DUF523 domain-containing protein [Spartinivicinus ruber]|uniref:DUF523 domain-containing protein n=1 Tax=Spartinivicinus ruber TaxID=2683272 RepID=UPI0013D7ACFD|nr:DUF523 domain-containing protein [Spartinivicinus ruber]